MGQGFLKSKTVGFIAAAILFLGSFYYLISVAFESRDVLSTSNTTIGAVFDAVIHTSKGDFTMQFYPSEAPKTRTNFISLAKTGFYDDTKFHRVVKNVLIQGGDPYTKRNDVSRYGTGDPGYYLKDEINDLPMKRGAVAMANKGEKNTAGSQFFILSSDRPDLDGRFTIFGFVSQGMETIDTINNITTGEHDRPLSPVVLESIDLRE